MLLPEDSLKESNKTNWKLRVQTIVKFNLRYKLKSFNSLEGIGIIYSYNKFHRRTSCVLKLSTKMKYLLKKYKIKKWSRIRRGIEQKSMHKELTNNSKYDRSACVCLLKK